MVLEMRRLAEVSRSGLVELFNHPRVRHHMPLLSGEFTIEDCERFLTAKERLWAEHGYGPWAFFVDGAFAGWGGLQPEGGDADLGLVLHPSYWGIGPRLCREFIRRAFEEMGLDSVTLLLPPSRTRVHPIRRLGFHADGEMMIGEERFVRFRLHNPAASRLAPAPGGSGSHAPPLSSMSADSVEQTFAVPVSLERAFGVFTEGFARWWPAEYTWSGETLQWIGMEPRGGGACFERGPEGFRCDWGRVLLWQPPRRLVISWQIGPTRVPEPNPEKASEIEIRFAPEGPERTRVDFEHRGFLRHGDGAEAYRAAMNGPGGWPYILARFARALA